MSHELRDITLSRIRADAAMCQRGKLLCSQTYRWRLAQGAVIKGIVDRFHPCRVGDHVRALRTGVSDHLPITSESGVAISENRQ